MINESEYIDLLVQVVRDTAASGRPHMTAAALGEQLRRAVSDQSWKDLGYPTLGQMLRSDKVEARLEVISTEKGALAVRPRPDAIPHEVPTHKEYNRLKKPVWGAFVMATPTGRRFLNRKSGAVRSGLQAPPVPYDEWAEIQAIPVATQKSWADKFLEDATFPVVDSMRAALHQPSWNHAFSVALGPNASEWNRFRSSKVATTIDAWASSSGIPHDLVFQSQTAIAPVTVPIVGTAVDLSDNDRAIILAALATLPTDRLREIALPAGALLSVLRNN
jgi:hypothetical protein